ncbi:MAG: hypothetical protein H6Q71_2038 [Firmicutes bacterium]|nr:hypothetical protein [Bacillota bacterium]
MSGVVIRDLWRMLNGVANELGVDSGKSLGTVIGPAIYLGRMNRVAEA